MSAWIIWSLAILAFGLFAWLAFRLSLRWWPSLVVRLGLLLLIILALGEGLNRENPNGLAPEVLLVDLSDSISDQSRQEIQAFADVWKEGREGRLVIVFGSGSDYVLSDGWPEVSGGGSELGDALELAAGHLQGSPGRILIATDGMVSPTTKLRQQLESLSDQGVAIDVLPVENRDLSGDVYIDEIRGAGSAWTGMRFPVIVTLMSQQAQTGTLQVIAGGETVIEEGVAMQVGANQFSVWLEAGSPGVMPVEIRVLSNGDPFPGNNVSHRAIEVHAQPDILLVTGAEENTRPMVQSLRNAGSKVTVISPETFPTNLDALDEFPVIFIHDVLSQDLNLEQMKAIEVHVTKLGRSVVFLGGRNSFTLGGYQNTILEPLLPVTLAPPERVQRVPITFLLVLDRSGSMAGDRDTEIAPIELTREAAMRAIETLRPSDYLGVLTFSAAVKWDVAIQPVGEGLELRDAQDKVSRIQAAGGTFMYKALEDAITALLEDPGTEYPHILLMSDGVSGDGSEDEFNALVRNARLNGISISTIALGRESDPQRLSTIASAGNGRFYNVLNPSDLPSVMISESKAVQAENIQEGRTNVIIGAENHPILSGFTLDRFPGIEGYIALQSKAALGAEDVLLSGNFGDPLLSTWQVGLGRTAAWMGDLGERWVLGMEDWDDQGVFWQQVIRYTLPDPSFGDADVRVVAGESEADRIVKLQLSEEDRDGLDPGSIKLLIPQEADKVLAVPLEQVGAVNYETNIKVPGDGAYGTMIQYSVSGETKRVMAPFNVNYPGEWKFGDPSDGAEQIDHWLTLTGGQQLTMDAEIQNTMLQIEEQKSFRWMELLLILLVISWPAEIAVRRRWMPWRRP